MKRYYEIDYDPEEEVSEVLRNEFRELHKDEALFWMFADSAFHDEGGHLISAPFSFSTALR